MKDIKEFTNKIIQGHTLEVLKEIPDNSISCVITSPPYWGLRDYNLPDIIWDGDKDCEHNWKEEITKRPNASGGKTEWAKEKLAIKGKENYSEFVDYNKRETVSNFCSKCGAFKGSLGLEPTIDLFIKHLVDIFDEIKRVLRDDGTVWVNLGDTYGTVSGGMEQLRKMKKDTPQYDVIPYADGYEGVKQDGKKVMDLEKSLCMVPERFAITMQDKGWCLRNKIIWYKPNHMPSSIKDRFSNSYELIFFFVKRPKYKFYLDNVRIPWAESSIQRLFRGVSEDNKYNQLEDKQSFGARGLTEPQVNIQKREIKTQQKEQLFNEQLPMLGGGSKKKCSEIMKNVQSNIEKSLKNTMRSPKYESADGHSNRQGLNRELSEVEKRKYEAVTKEVCGYLKEWRKKKHLDLKYIAELMQYPESTISHFFRTDLSGACLPTPEQWWKLKEILGFDDKFDKTMTETIITDNAIKFSNMGRNPGDCWKIEGNKTDEFNYSIGMRDKEFVEFRNLPSLKEIADYINEYRKKKSITIDKIEELFGSQAPHHWFSGESYPSKEDWIKLKKILEFDNKYDKAITEVFLKPSEKQNYPEGKNPADIWFISTSSFSESHFAVFPPKLVETILFAITKPGDIVLDPFIGAGTTALVCAKYNRKYIGYEINKDYIKIINKRLEGLQINLPIY